MTPPRVRADVEREAVSLTDFLLARLAEDEAAASVPEGVTMLSGDYYDVPFKAYDEHTCDERSGSYLQVDPARVLAECEAKRRIVEMFTDETVRILDTSTLGHPDRHAAVRGREPRTFNGRAVISALAAVYADHPDYRDEWRP